MFKKNDDKRQTAKIECLIGETTLIDGTLSFSRGLRIDGRVKGNVVQMGDEPSVLVLSERGRIDGEVRVSQAIINGTVVGPVHGATYVELQPKARVTGDVHYKTIEIHPGAVIKGRLMHQEDEGDSNVIPLVQQAGAD